MFSNENSEFSKTADEVLNFLQRKRGDDPDRPLVMMGHSLGGILIKQILVKAHENSAYHNIKKSTFGLVFFGTLHQGPGSDSKVAFGQMCSAIVQSLRPGVRENATVKALEKGSIYSQGLRDSFKHQLEDYQIISFYEKIGNVVPRDSAVLGLPGSRETVVGLSADHSNICRFNLTIDADIERYEIVSDNVVRLCKLATDPGDTLVAEILKSLERPAYNARFEDIEQGFQGTSEWIWVKRQKLTKNRESQGPGFVEWLESGDAFWLNGLPDSGKSTLMKYILDSPKMRQHLNIGSQDNVDWLLVQWFFHELSQETSFEQLLSSLLFQILTSERHLIGLIAPFYERSKSRPQKDANSDIWVERDLRESLETIVTKSNTPFKLCVFVDGLDECAPREGLPRRLEFLLKWFRLAQNAKRKTLKLCIASRDVTEVWEGLREITSCKIHNWTDTSIVDYARENLSTVFDCRPFASDNPAQNQLLETLCLGISEKSNGVFLWVDLVVKELATAIEDGLDDDMILNHLDTMPKGLGDLYGRIMANIPSNLIYDALNFFMMLQHKDGTGRKAVPKRLTLEELGICVHRSDVASVGDFKSESEELLWLTNICGITKMRLRSSCRGLIQAQPNNSVPPIFKSLPSVKVGWMHLTVQEFASENLEKLHARATEMSKVERKRIPLVNSHRFYMVLSVRLLKICAARWYGYESQPRARMTFKTKVPLPSEHLADCVCLSEFQDVRFPWDERKSGRLAWKAVQWFFHYAYAFEDCKDKRLQAHDPRAETQPYFDEMKRTCTMLCPSLLDYYCDYRRKISNHHGAGGVPPGIFPAYIGGPTPKRPPRPTLKLNKVDREMQECKDDEFVEDENEVDEDEDDWEE